MDKENKAVKVSDEELEKVTGGDIDNPWTWAGTLFATVAGGLSYQCTLCWMKPANRAMANHLVNQHGFTREEAMNAVPEELRAIQWD